MSTRGLRAYFSVFAVGLLLFTAFAFRPSVILGVDGKTLGDSLNGAVTTGGDVKPCKESGDTWRCTLHPTSGGDTNYELTVDRWGCWKAKQTNGAPAGGDGTLDGCITLLDH